MAPEDSDTSTDLNWFKTYAEKDLADAREYLPGYDVDDLIIEVSEKVMPGDVKQILRLAENHINELFLTNVQTPVTEDNMNAFHLLRVRMQEVIIEHLRNRVEESGL